jgi:hypothetical protein
MGLCDTHPTEVLRFVGISYADGDYFYWLTIAVCVVSHPPAVLESSQRSAFFHLYDTRFSVTRALREDSDNAIGEHSDKAV